MTESMTTQPQARKVIVGVDTRKHVHVAVAIDTWGIRLGLRPRRLVRCGTGREAGTPLLCFSFRGDPGWR